MGLFFEDVVTEQDDPAHSWSEADHGQCQFIYLFFNPLYFKYLRRG